MSFKELDLKRSYISYGDNNITKSFLIPALMHTKLYRRSVGFFSSSVITSIMDGIVALGVSAVVCSFAPQPTKARAQINAKTDVIHFFMAVPPSSPLYLIRRRNRPKVPCPKIYSLKCKKGTTGL